MTTTPPTPTPEGTTAPPPAPEPAEAPERHGDTPSREAARYRTRLREAEAERDALTERLTTYQRKEVERLAGASLSKPSDVWLDNADISAMIDESGDVDAEAVAVVVKAVLDGRPGLAPRVGDHGGGRRENVGSAPTWGDVLSGRKG